MKQAAPAGRPSELVVRTVVGAALAASALGAIYVGGILFWLVCAVLGIVMLGEWVELQATPAAIKRLAQFALFVPLAMMFPPPLLPGPGFFTLGLLAGAAFFIVIVTRRPVLGAGLVYVGLPVLALLLIRAQPEGRVFTLWTFALVWMCDIGAYVAGRVMGGPRLAPAISPNKTWAGLVGGMALASALAAAMHIWLGLPMRLTLATPVLALVAQGGDLFESWLKRRAGVKDSGKVLPGHGGILDRLDGLVPVAPLAAFLVILPRFYV